MNVVVRSEDGAVSLLVDEIGDVVRHRSRTSTAIYAKHDIEGLRLIARDWPIEGGRA